MTIAPVTPLAVARTRTNTSTYTVEQLKMMSDDEFDYIVTENLRHTTRFNSPFQQDEVVRRTLLSLTEKLHLTDARIADMAEDPEVAPEKYAGARKFRRHLLGAIDVTHTRASFLITRAEREASQWKELLHRVCDEIEGDELLDDILDDPEFTIPFADAMTLRVWREIRVQKDPSRAIEAVAA